MHICNLCTEQSKKNRRSSPHALLIEVDDRRLFKGANARSYEEQDYRCLHCTTKFTWSNNKNDFAWTLWQG